MMRVLLVLSLILCTGRLVLAQQEQQYTQFMFNKLAYNPGYAGSSVSPTLSVIYRNQWMGFDGAPQTQMISYSQSLLNEKIGIGANLVRNTIGINRALTAELTYAYRIPWGHGYLGVGIEASIRHLKQDWTDPRLLGSQPLSTDIAIPVEPKTKIVPNAGVGLFYTGPKWYVGAAIPRVIQNNIDFAENGGNLSREVRHFNAMGGVSFEISDGMELTPQLLLKYVSHAPFDADINVSLFVKRKFYSGLTYRTGGDTSGAGESLDAMFGLQATKNLFMCLSYDIGISSLRRYHNGSIEATARWAFNVAEGDQFIDPRNPDGRYPW